MTASSFLPFPRLPTELRLQVWIAACVSHRPDGHGIHYIDVEPTSTEGTLSPSSTFTACLAEGDKESVCLSNGGLWMACKESRYVMMQYAKVDGHDCKRISIRGDEEGWYCPVCPRHDIFCIKSKTWNTVDDHDKSWQIQIPDLSSKGSQTMHIENIAFEFHESWNTDLPQSYYDLMAESSARGFLSRLLYNRYLNSSTTPQVWIIVKNGQWTASPRQEDTTQRWQNYDTDYVRTRPYLPCQHCRRNHDFDGVFQNVRSFTYDLDILGLACENDHRNYTPIYDDVEYGAFYDQFGILSDVKFLAERDKQIDICTGRVEEEEEEEEDVDMGF